MKDGFEIILTSVVAAIVTIGGIGVLGRLTRDSDQKKRDHARAVEEYRQKEERTHEMHR